MNLEHTEAETVKLEGIPGLKVYPTHANGSPDAVAAGLHALGRPLPPFSYVNLKVKEKGARQYQNDGISFLMSCLRMYGGTILADEMGLGKTFQTIAILKRLMQGRALILCPGSVRETWRTELTKWGFSSSKIAVLYPNKSSWINVASASAVVCSYHHDMIERAINLGFAGEHPEFLIMDEAHRLRGRDSKRSAVLNENVPMIPYKVALTGTPQWNSMKDWWQLLHILFDRSFGSQWDFDLRYAGAKRGHHGGLEYPKKEDKNITPALLHTDELNVRLQRYMLARMKSEVAKELPPMTISIRWVDGTSEAKRALMKMHMNVGKGSVHEAIVATLKGKVDEVLELAQEARRFVLTTWTNSGAQELHRLLNDQGTPCLLVSASMSGPVREATIQQAISSRCGIVATTDLLAEGMNLQHVASVGILHALDFAPSKMAQLFGRLHRIDITAPVQWHVVAMKDSVDQYIIDAGVFKLDAISAVMGKQKNATLRNALKNDKQEAASERQALANLYAAMEANKDHVEDDD